MIAYDTQQLETQRVIRGMTRSEIAEAARIHPATYRRVIKGENSCPRTVKKIADVLGLPMEKLIVNTAA